ncbi:Uncharacterized protein PHSC3_000016 [Chlamydiales bacterium STE3]|nr:Uncharacterized protein PHSC3_000016 [Chlamydiales bacterium STE3]
MELREWAIQILSAEVLEDKLLKPEVLTDEHPGPSLIFKEPCRPPHMTFNRRSKEEKLPSFQELQCEQNRAICLHRFAGHELLAVEIMAYVILAFPDAPKSFRKGVAHVLKEEQGHVKIYMERLQAMGVTFGDLPLYRHFWAHTPYIQSPLHYVSMMSLTFEMANLDFAPIYGKIFSNVGDKESAALMATILRDEISHVRFGWQWLNNLKDQNQSEWEAWEAILDTTLLTPKRAKGFFLHPENRFKAGINAEFVEKLNKL